MAKKKMAPLEPLNPSTMHVVASTLPEFVSHIESAELYLGNVVFRGQDCRGGLLPGIARKDPTLNTEEVEREMLGEFDRLGAPMIPPNMTLLDRMVLAQHHGMKTRLLDWNQNPLAALWFACSGRSPGHAFVYALDTDGLYLSPEEYARDPFKRDATKVLLPRMTNSRLHAQHGLFTLHRYSVKLGRFVPLEEIRTTKARLFEIVIPEDKRGDLLQSLDRNGINARTLFPDVDGLCRYLNWRNEA